MQGVRLGVCFVASLVAAISLVPEASARGGKECPENISGKYYANPTVKKRPRGLEPTGLLTPNGICTFPTLSEAVVSASEFEGGGTVIATGAKPGKPAKFSKESLPLEIESGVTVTTVDQPSLGGNGFHPANYVVVHKANQPVPAISLAGESTLRGLRLQNDRRTDGDAMLTCAASGVRVGGVILDGKSKKGGEIATGLHATAGCAGTFSDFISRKFAEEGAFVGTTGAPLEFTESGFTKNGATGLVHHTGHVELDTSGASLNKGDGVDSGTGLVGGPPPPTELTITNDSTFNGNDGAGLRTGFRTNLSLQGDPTVPYTSQAHFDENGGPGLLIGGAAQVQNVSAADGESDGIVLDFVSENTLVQLFDADSIGNAGHGVLVRDTGGNVASYNNGTIANNEGDGLRMDAGGHGLAVLSAGGLSIHDNEIGLHVEDSPGGENNLVPQALDVFDNRAEGGLIERSYIVDFYANKFHNNGLNQLVFDGGGNGTDFAFYIDGEVCGIANNFVYDYGAAGTFGVLARNDANVTIRHMSFEGGGTGLRDFSSDAESTIDVAENCEAFP